MGKRTFVALGRIEHDSHVHEVGEVVEDLDNDLEIADLLRAKAVVEVSSSKGEAFAASIANERMVAPASNNEADHQARVNAFEAGTEYDLGEMEREKTPTAQSESRVAAAAKNAPEGEADKAIADARKADEKAAADAKQAEASPKP